MRKVIFTFLIIMTLSACQKHLPVYIKPCQNDAATVGNLLNAKVTVKQSGSGYLLIPEGAIDTRYNPCNLPDKYAVDNKTLTIDAEVKATLHNDMNPCCTEDIVISKLSER